MKKIGNFLIGGKERAVYSIQKQIKDKNIKNSKNDTPIAKIAKTAKMTPILQNIKNS